jgi:glutamyl-tRNA reductase
MSIILVGLDQHTATVDLRERFSLSGCGLQVALAGLGEPAQEAVILSTCNRLEVYAVTGSDAQTGWAMVEESLCRVSGLTAPQLAPHLYALEGREAIGHLMRVAAGLDSAVLGEPQILGQVAQAFSDAREGAKVGPILTYLFSQAVHAGKRARTETEISRHTTSVSHAAVMLAEKMTGDLSRARILVAGAGEMADLAAQALQMHGVQSIACINRSFEHAHGLSGGLEVKTLNWRQLGDALAEADVVITATGAPHPVIYPGDVLPALSEREGRPLVIIDIAVPRDVDGTVGALPGVILFDIDHLESTLDANLAMRQAAVPDVQAIVEEELAEALGWLHGRQVVPVIDSLHRRSRSLADTEVEETLRRLDRLDEREREAVARMAHRIVSKLLHEPTVRLKECAASGNGHGYAHAIKELFDLPDPDTAGPTLLGSGQGGDNRP